MYISALFRKLLQHDGIQTLGAISLATYFLLQAVPQRYFRMDHSQKVQEIQRIKRRFRRAKSLLLNPDDYDCH